MSTTTPGPSTLDQLSPRAARSRSKILVAATALLVESGPRAVTVDAVAEASGVAKSTLYRHWPSRNDLLVDVLRSNIPRVDPPDPSSAFEPALRHLVTSAAEIFSDPQWPRIYAAMTSLRTSMPELDSFIDADISNKKKALSAVLEAGEAEGALPQPVDVDDAVNLLVGPLVFAATTCGSDGLPDGQLLRFADFVVDRFIASYQ